MPKDAILALQFNLDVKHPREEKEVIIIVVIITNG
jgi:hypothetical protein